ncbi:hypothetical protein SAMN05421786_109158 [Chryseobacterium ureilyticum]|uniref:Uncharacterized protein n=1 Tax=Chryseobacterium ureilyticum TaxID=373668 RepID=A0A1N7QGX5_9FLAO|nr:hypothetical protein SAMN05421786_109158 [Chryseobacterium ureilyticum]
MKRLYKEKNKLPLTFKYLDLFKTKNTGKLNSDSLYYLNSDKFQTVFYPREKPFKSLHRLL